MNLGLMNLSGMLPQKLAVDAIMGCNGKTAQYGLVLSEEQAAVLAQARSESLAACGRVEFGGGVIEKIILGFCDSPYISTDSYEETLLALTEMFYYYKNETLDLLSDDALIKFMRASFDGECEGSLELLSGQALERLVRGVHGGVNAGFDEAGERRRGDEGDEDGEY